MRGLLFFHIFIFFLAPVISLAVAGGGGGSSGGGGGGGTPAWNQQKFWFRDDDGSEVTATGFGALNVVQNTNIINVPPGTAFRLRFAIKLTQADGSIAPRLEFKQGTDCATGTWNMITPSSNNFNLRLSDNFIDGASTTQQLVGGPNFIAGKIFESTNPAATLSLLKNQSTEYEWSLQAAANIPFATTYSFRITNNGTNLNTYDQCPSLTTQAAPSPPPATPGGGGLRATEVIFSGRAFPGAKIFIVGKDISAYPAPSERIMSQDIVVSGSGDFKTQVFTVSPINQKSFGLLIKDQEGRTTQTKFFSVDPFGTSLVAKDILAPPTIGFHNRLVTRGASLTAHGYALPGSTVSVEIDNTIKKETTASKDGSYNVEVATGALDFGPHRVRAKQVLSEEKRESDFSPTNTFVVSRLLLPKADVSGDGKVDIKDWSMFLSRWASKDKEQKKIIDFNGDGKVDISDFSIFVRAIRKR